MPFYTVKHYSGGKWQGDTCLTANDRQHAIRLGLETVAVSFPYWRKPDSWKVYHSVDMNNASTYVKAKRGYRVAS